MSKPTFIIRKLSDSESCDDFLIKHDAPFTQSLMYATWHRNLGRAIHRYAIEITGSSVKQIGYVQFIEASLFLGKKYLYASYGPVIDLKYFAEVLPFIKSEFTKIAQGIGAAFFRLDFTPTLSDATTLLCKKTFFKSPRKTYKGAHFQNREEWFLDIHPNESELYNTIHSKHRYCFRSAEKKNCKVVIITERFMDHFDTFCTLMKETASRNSFYLHSEDYYRSIFTSLETSKSGYLVTTTVDGVITNIMLFVYYGRTVMYVFSGSIKDQKNIPSGHLALWHSIRHAKSIGLAQFNFGGLSTKDFPDRSMTNLTQFKTRFGGHLVRHSDFYDLIIKPSIYVLFVLRKFFR